MACTSMTSSRAIASAFAPSTSLLSVLVLWLSGVSLTLAAFDINSIEHRPSYIPEEGEAVAEAGPPIDLKKHTLTRDGFIRGVDSSVNVSRFTHIGCFEADMSIQTFSSEDGEGFNFDPNECLTLCRGMYSNISTYDIIVAVHQDKCACVLKDMSVFKEKGVDDCTYYCKYYRNPICGGPPQNWGVFKEYDFQSLTSQGAYDPWRYTWYSLVAIRDTNIRGGVTPDGAMPERYYLHAVDINSGEAQYQYMMPVEGLLYGLQYDIDGTRLVALHSLQTTGRIRKDADWKYKLATILINTTFEDKPVLSMGLAKVEIEFNESKQYLQFSGASGILSVTFNVFIITQSEPAELKKDMKDRIYFIRIPDGLIIQEHALDFKVLQIYTNEKYGDVTCLGPRLQLGLPGAGSRSSHGYVYLARVRRDEIEEKTVIEWQYNNNNPDFVTPLDKTADMQIYPGLSVSEHLFNYSGIAHRKAPLDPETGEPDLAKAAFLIAEVNIRTQGFKEWCNRSLTDGVCVGTMDYEIPYAGIYNQQPGIPLSLKAPTLVEARFTIQAGTILVDFDRATLQGAITVDVNFDLLPDEIDYSTQPEGLFDCAEVFNADTVLLLGAHPDTECLWMTDSRIQINLPPVINISVGDSLFLNPDKIYTIPRNGEWSPAASGGIQVDPPDPLEPPVIVLTGSTNLDECTPVKLDATDSFQDGKLPVYRWELLNSTESEPNPKDLTNSPNRVFDAELFQAVVDSLSNATNKNLGVLEMPSNFLESATTYRILLSVTSRWGLTQQKTVLLTKLNFPAPMVSILGPAEVETTRRDRVSLQAKGTPSACANQDDRLGYEWTCTSGNLDFDEFPSIVSAASTLSIAEFILEPDLTDENEFNIYNFSVRCFVNTPQGNNEARSAFASVAVLVRRSPIFVQFATESRMMTIGDVLVLDARSTNDPDYPTNPGQTFRGNFLWTCLTPEPERGACFGGPANGRLGGPDGEDLTICRQDIGTQIQEGGTSFFAPLFDDLVFCKYARGVMMFQTTNFTVGEYKFSVLATSFDGRQATGEVWITMTEVVVPKIVLSVRDPKAKYPVSVPIRIEGTREGQTTNQTMTYAWSVWVYLMNSEYDPDVARERANDGEIYTVDEFKFVDQSDKYDTTDPVRFTTSPTQPNIVIKSNALQSSTKYKFRLQVRLPTVTGFSDVTLETAGLPPRNGNLTVVPINASMVTPRQATAHSWVADELPLTYEFGWVKIGEGGEEVKQSQTSDPQPVSSITFDNLILGDASDNYSLTLYVAVRTSMGAVTEDYAEVQSLPVENATEAVAEGLANAENLDGANVVKQVDVVLSMDPTNSAAQAAALDILAAKEGDIPQTPSQLSSQADVYAQIATNTPTFGPVADKVMDGLEKTTIAVASSPEALSSAAPLLFGAMAVLTPGEDATDEGGASAQSVSMDMFRNENTNFKFRDMTAGKESTQQFLKGMTRQIINHEIPIHSNVIRECNSVFCDKVSLKCNPKDGQGPRIWYICCDEPNPHLACDDPPCWFPGRCPARKKQGLAASRRLKQPAHIAAQARDRGDQLSADEGEWLRSWKNNEMPLEHLDVRALSESDRAAIFSAWHPDWSQRRLQISMTKDNTVAPGERLLALEARERPFLLTAQRLTEEAEVQSRHDYLADAKQQVAFNGMSEAIAARLKAEKARQDEELKRFNFQKARNSSQRITRINVMRDTLGKALIQTLVSNEVPLRFDLTTFILTIGKTTNMSNVHPSFVFPKRFQVPADSPDFPTPTNPVTGFSFIFVQYKKNIYDFSDSNPKSSGSRMITLQVMKASTLELDSESTDDPVKVFADIDLFSNAVCLFWDRFAIGTAGGAWSSTGVVNDGHGCLTSHLSDFGIFLDGRTFTGNALVDAATHWEREVWSSNCIGCGESSNLFVVAVLGMTLFTLILLILMGYTMDESVRTDMAKNKVKSRYYFDGNGVDTPLSVDDPIAYKSADGALPKLWIATFWNVVKRDHALISSAFYHETFTRPQRLQCFISLLTGLLAINATVHSNPGYIQEAKEYIISGVLSGILVFPVFCGLAMMFNLRPVQVKKRLIKRAYSTKEIDKLSEQRQRLANQSSMLPPPGYMALPPPPPGSIQGNTTLLSLPAPLPLPPMPAGMVGLQAHLTLPPPPGPGSGMAPLALPGMSGNRPLPPPPRNPPPPKNGMIPSPAALMPPLSWPRNGPPPTPFPALQDASMGGTSQLPFFAGNLPGTGEAPDMMSNLPDQELPALPPNYVTEDGKHQMMPPTGTMAPEQPSGGTPTPGTPKSYGPPGTPPVGTPGGGVGPLSGGGASPAHSQRSGAASSRFGPGPPLPGSMVPMDSGPMPLFIRGQPPPNVPSPFPSAPAGPSGMMPFQVPPGGPPGGMPGMGGPAVPLVPPAPPPPPKEDDQAFVRRIRLTYMDKVSREHDKHDLLEDLEELGKETAGWVYDIMTIIPYLAASLFTLASVFIVLQYGMKFQRFQEEMWLKGSLIGLGLDLGVLDIVRLVMMTLVELRKYENRRKSKDGHFLPRRIKRDNDKDFQPAPPPRLWKQAVAAPSIPKGPGINTAPPPRPNYLPQGDGGTPKAGGMPGMGNLPIGAGPPGFSAAAMAAGGGFSGPPGPPTLQNRGASPGPSLQGTGRSGNFAPQGGLATPPPGGTPQSTGRGPGPKLQSAADLIGPGQGAGSRGPSRGVSPRSAASLGSQAQSLAQSLKQQSLGPRHTTPPPPPGATVQTAGAGGPPPPPPSASPPNYSRPPSAGSRGAKAPTPPS